MVRYGLSDGCDREILNLFDDYRLHKAGYSGDEIMEMSIEKALTLLQIDGESNHQEAP